MPGFSAPVPEGVGVETITLLAYEDGRPSELFMCGTDDPNVKYLRLTATGSRGIIDAVTAALHGGGVAEVISDGPIE